MVGTYGVYDNADLKDTELSFKMITSNGVVTNAAGDPVLPAACQATCDANTACQAVVYDYVTGRCATKKTATSLMYVEPDGNTRKAVFIKPNVASWTPQPVPGSGQLMRVTGGLKPDPINNIAFDNLMLPGRIIKTMYGVENSLAGIQTCVDEARTRPDAMGFQYNKKQQSCSIKAKFPTDTRAMPNEDTALYVKASSSPWKTGRAYTQRAGLKLKPQYFGPNGAKYIGSTYVLANAASYLGCSQLCDATSGCDTYEMTGSTCRLINGGSGYGVEAFQASTGDRTAQYSGPTEAPTPPPSQQYCNLYSGSLVTPAPTTTLAPTTLNPTTLKVTTLNSTTLNPTTLNPTTLNPTTLAPTTIAPTADPAIAACSRSGGTLSVDLSGNMTCTFPDGGVCRRRVEKFGDYSDYGSANDDEDADYEDDYEDYEEGYTGYDAPYAPYVRAGCGTPAMFSKSNAMLAVAVLLFALVVTMLWRRGGGLRGLRALLRGW